MNLSRIKLNGTRLVTATDVNLPSSLTPNHQTIRGIKLNGNAVIDFQSYDKCGPGPVTMAETLGCYTLITSNGYSRYDTNCNLDTVENEPYIPYRGVAGIIRAALFAGLEGNREVAVNFDFAINPELSNIAGQQETGTFGYPTDESSLGYPAITAESFAGPEQITPDEYMARLLFPTGYCDSWESPNNWTGPEKLAISNFYSRTSISANYFDLGDGTYTGNLPEQPSDYPPETERTPILFDQNHLIAGSFGVRNWGTSPDPSSFEDSLKIVTYDDARLWYTAGLNFQLDGYSIDNLYNIVFIGCTHDQISAFLEGIKYQQSQGYTSLDIESLVAEGRAYSTGFEDNDNSETFIQRFQSIKNALGWDLSGTYGMPNEWTLSDNTAIIIGLSFPTADNSIITEPIFGNVYANISFIGLLLHAIANTSGCTGCLVSDFPRLFSYSYMGFNGQYNLLGPISPWLDPFDANAAQIQSTAADWPDRLVEYCVNPELLFNFICNPENSILFSNNRGVLNNEDACLKFYMSSNDTGNPDILAKSTEVGGEWDPIAGDESSYSSNYQVNFADRTLNFTINADSIS